MKKYQYFLRSGLFVSLGLYVFALMTSMALMEIFSTLAVIFILLNMRLQRTQWRDVLIGPDRWLWLFEAAVVVSSLANFISWGGTLDMLGWSRWIFLLYCWTWCFRHFLSPRMERAHYAILAFCVVIGFYCLYQFIYGHDLFRPNFKLDPIGPYFRAQGFFNLCLTFAYSIGMIGLTGLSLALVKGQQRQWLPTVFATIGFLFCVLSIFLTLTRGAWIGMAIATFIGLFMVSRPLALTMPLLVTALAKLAMLDPTVADRFASITDTGNESNSLRLLLWRSNFLIFRDHPFLGVGIGQNKLLLPEYYARLGASDVTFYSHAHNNILQVLSGLGIFGLIAYVGFSVWFLWTSLQLWYHLPKAQTWYRSLALGIFTAQIYFHIGGMTECNFTHGQVNHLLIFMWSIVAALRWRFIENRSVRAVSESV